MRGLMMAEELLAALGIPSPITERMLDDMVKGARPHPDRADAGDWDGQGFRAGVEDMQRVEKTPAGIRAFLESEACQVTYEELVFLYRQINPHGNQALIPSMLT